MANSDIQSEQGKVGDVMGVDTVESSLERDVEILNKFPDFILDRLSDQGSCELDALVESVPVGTEMARIYFVTDSIERLRRYGLVTVNRTSDGTIVVTAAA
jgi:hypothetical protein